MNIVHYAADHVTTVLIAASCSIDVDCAIFILKLIRDVCSHISVAPEVVQKVLILSMNSHNIRTVICLFTSKCWLVGWKSFSVKGFWPLWGNIYEYVCFYNRFHGNAVKGFWVSIYVRNILDFISAKKKCLKLKN
jgi:hypothetical protein